MILSGLRGLWEATGDTTYLTDGYAYVETVINATGWYATSRSEASQWAGLGRNGIMEDYCDAPASCSQNNQIFKGIYFHHLDMFCQPLPTSNPLITGLTKTASLSLAGEHAAKCSSYTPWIEHNAHAALATRNASDIIGLWWGAPYDNLTQASWPSYAVPLPHGSTDEWNNPEVLNQPPWVCQGRYCNPHGRGRAMSALFQSRMSKRQSDGAGQIRNVQTQGAGLGVVKAASDFTLKRPAM